MKVKAIGAYILVSSVVVVSLIGSATALNARANQVNTGLVVDISEIVIDNRIGLRVYQGAAFTGEAITYYATGKKSRSEQFVNGKRHGHVKMWFVNGVLSFDSQYENGRRKGVTRSWWNSGNKRSQTEYIDDKINGVGWQWYRSGEKFKRSNHVDGQPIGLQKGWRTNGKLFSNFEYKNGRIYGLRKANLCVELTDEEIIDERVWDDYEEND